jgi:biotin carboxyl carrier protein
MAATRLVARVDNEEVRLEVQPDGHVRLESVPGASFQVTSVRDGEYLVCEGKPDAASPTQGARDPSVRQWRVWVAGPPEARSVYVGGEVIELEIAPEGSRRRGGRAGADTTAAPMPATVVEIFVGPGQEVRHGDVLLKLEAMKMELPLRAPRDGRVAAVRCTPGELVQPGVPLVEME